MDDRTGLISLFVSRTDAGDLIINMMTQDTCYEGGLNMTFTPEYSLKEAINIALNKLEE